MMTEIVAVISANPYPDWDPNSKYWRGALRGLEDAKKFLPKGTTIKIVSPRRPKYHDYEGIMSEAVECEPDCIIAALTRKVTVDQLKRYHNKIVAFDVPPDEQTRREFGTQIVGYVGIDHECLGERAADELISCAGDAFNKVLVIMHDNYGHHLRYNGVQGFANGYGYPVDLAYLDDKTQTIEIPKHFKGCDIGVVALGTKDVAAAIKCIPAENLKGLVGIDINEYIVKLIETDQMACTFVQNPYKMARKAVELALGNITQPCPLGTTIADAKTARLILEQQKW